MTSFRGYKFYENKDSLNFDLRWYNDKTIQELKELCDKDDRCIGFNTNGYLKTLIYPEFKFVPVSSDNKITNGLFVNIERYKKMSAYMSCHKFVYVS